MVYMKVKLYLKSNFKVPSLKFTWTKEKNEKFFEYLLENFDLEYISQEKKVEEIREAFVDFFKPVGYIIFKFTQNRIGLKVLPYKVDPKDSKHLSKLISIIHNNEELIDYDYNGREDQIVIQGKLREMLYEYADSIKDEKVNTKELVKYAVKEGLELEDSDLVLNNKTKIFIKLIDIDVKVQKEEKRFNGFDEGELEALYDEYFDKDSIEEFLSYLSKQVFEVLFLEKKVTNKWYEKNIYPYVQRKIAQELSEIDEFANKSNSYKEGFAGYIFRVNFISFFELLADKLLYQVYLKNEYVVNFLKYYGGQIFIDEDEQYQAPSLIAKDGTKWNPAAINGIIISWFKIKENIENIQYSIKTIDKKLKDLMIEDTSPIEYHNILMKEKAEVQECADGLHEDIDKLLDKKYLSRDRDEIDRLNKQLKILKDELDECKADLKEIAQEIESIKTYKEFKKLTEEKIKIVRGLQREKKVLEERRETYESVHSAVVKALISKRKNIRDL